MGNAEDDDVDAKADPDVTPAGEQIFVNQGPFQCSNCKAAHDCLNPLNSSLCCENWWVISISELPAISYVCGSCDKEHEVLCPPQSSRCCENMTILEMY